MTRVKTHSDIIGRGSIHISGRFRNAAKDISAPDDDCHFHSQIVDGLNLSGDRFGYFGIDAVVLVTH
jgi:hypothetical protein